ncbi:hypothetical protein [Clostridioides sp. ES-S-0001-02]|uniref:hypothetical protein n=1 Tax=Clostridioides sp. ES-S-0001-02 TaxID=2770770 RepID=UPI001D0FD791|nr:hypothetical protein [Clostridioides sp. ES-S-0001-02]
MKIAIITTEFLKEFVANSIKKLNINAEIEIYIYKDFSHVGDLYLEIEDKFDGFAVSGPIPKEAITKKVGTIKKPLVDFGTDLQSYYDMFLKLIFKYNTLDFSRAYFDLMDWADNPKDISYYLSNGTFGDLMCSINENASKMSLSDIAELEKNIEKKHIKLWNEGKIDFSTTRFSSIVPMLQDAGVNFHFIYPDINLLKSTFNELIKDIHLHRMKVNQPGVIYITVKDMNHYDYTIDQIYKILNNLKKDKLTDFIIEKDSSSFKIFTKCETIKSLTKNFTTCYIKESIENSINLKVCVGYGIGNNIKQAMSNAINANKESKINPLNYSFLVNESYETIGPLLCDKLLTVSNKVTPHINTIAKNSKLSTLTIQKIISVIEILQRDEVTPKELSSCLNVTVRTANRFLSSLLKSGNATILYEKQNSTKGRPERVYKLFISENKH